MFDKLFPSFVLADPTKVTIIKERLAFIASHTGHIHAVTLHALPMVPRILTFLANTTFNTYFAVDRRRPASCADFIVLKLNSTQELIHPDYVCVTFVREFFRFFTTIGFVDSKARMSEYILIDWPVTEGLSSFCECTSKAW